MPKKRKTRKKARRRVVARVQVPRICSARLSRLLASGAESRESLRLTLGEAVKRLWAYAKAHGLQDGRELRCDAHMQRLFGQTHLTMFEVSGALSTHMQGASASGAVSTSTSAPATASSALGATTSNAPLVTLSPALTSLFCGSRDGRGGGQRQLTLTQTEALRQLGKYITRCGLRDRVDRRRINCDAALAEIVGKGSFTIYEAKELLARHLTPTPGSAAARAAAAATTAARAASHTVDDAAAEEEGEEEEGEEEGEESGEEEESEEQDGQDDNEAPSGAAAGGHSLTATAGGGSWACAQCTLINDARRSVCDACDGPRESSGDSGGISGSGGGGEVGSGGGGSGSGAVDGGSSGSEAVAASAAEGMASAGNAAATVSSGPPHKRQRTAPSEYLCPITQEIMVDPVSTSDGHTYERAAIRRWLARKHTSPLTGAVLTSTTLVPNHVLRKLIDDFRATGGHG